MGIWACVAREAEIPLLLIRAFYSKNKTGVLIGYLAGNDKGKDWDVTERHKYQEHQTHCSQLSLLTSSSRAFYMRKSNITAGLILIFCVIVLAAFFGSFLHLLYHNAFSLQGSQCSRKQSTEECMA